MEFRIGVNLGDVIEDDSGIIFGDGVNIAARMESLAEPGGICISSSVYDAVEGKVHFGYDFLGEQHVKNIAKPVSVYRVRANDQHTPDSPGISRPRWLLPALGALTGLAAAAELLCALEELQQLTRQGQPAPTREQLLGELSQLEKVVSAKIEELRSNLKQWH
jgi:hypothetical protein